MSTHGTASVSGAYIEFQSAVLKALPRDIDDDTALTWANNGEALARFLEGLRPDNGEVEKAASQPILRLISESENLVIDPTDGAETLAKADDFFAYVDPDFVNWGLDEASRPTEKAPVEVYEMVRDANFDTMFRSISNNLDDLCFTQSQIKRFCVKHKNWLRTDGYGTFFLFKSNGKFFVAIVIFDARGRPGVGVHGLGHDDVWRAGDGHRVVLPQL